jgi:hypothetical protein
MFGNVGLKRVRFGEGVGPVFVGNRHYNTLDADEYDRTKEYDNFLPVRVMYMHEIITIVEAWFCSVYEEKSQP